MTAQQIIRKKQAGEELTSAEINFLVDGYVRDHIPDYQVSAFLMAVYFQGMTYEETYHLTLSMLNSGEKIRTDTLTGFKADKHSTGGVGDKVSLILAPLVAAAGVIVPMISGRGLGHSGGTLDKLESIPGFRTNLNLKDCEKQLSQIGVALIGQTARIVPADKKIYALRDSTSTVKSIPLITASILSKKLAEGLDALVIDMKIGKGAFFKSQLRAVQLTDSLIAIGDKFNLKISCLFTAMNQPLGHAIGNWLEMKEAIATLKGHGPKDLLEVTLSLSAEILVKARIEKNYLTAKKKLMELIRSGLAYEKFKEIVHHQKGDARYIDQPHLYPLSKRQINVEIDRRGYIKEIDAMEIGLLSMEIGAGRKTINDSIDYKAGIILTKKVGDQTNRHEKIAEVYTDEDVDEDQIKNRVLKAFIVSQTRVVEPKSILSYATKEGMSKWPL